MRRLSGLSNKNELPSKNYPPSKGRGISFCCRFHSARGNLRGSATHWYSTAPQSRQITYFSRLPKNPFRRRVTMASFCGQPIPRSYDPAPGAVGNGDLRLFRFSVFHQISNPSCNTWLVALSDRCPAGPGPVGFGQLAGSDGLEPQLRVRRRDTPIHFPQTGSPVATVIVSQRDARISQPLGSLSGCADIWRQPAYYKAWRAQQLAH